MNKTSEYDFTVIIPVYDEQDNMLNLEKALLEWIPTCRLRTCILFVNDGSHDLSLQLMKEICGRNDCFFYISFGRNRGITAAIKAGIDYTESRLLGYMDADMQQAPSDFNKLLEHIDSYSMVTGYRANRKDSAFKKFQSRFANGFRRLMTHDGAIDTGCPLKVLHTDVAKRLPMFKGMHRFIPALVLLQEGGTYRQVPVQHFPRTAGKSKFHIWNRLWGPFCDCFAYRWMKRRFWNYDVKESKI